MSDKSPTIFDEQDITAGNSPVTVNLAETQGHSIGGFIIVNTGPARFTVQESIDGDSFGDSNTLEPKDVYKINSRTEQANSPFLDRILVTRGTADSKFKIIGSAGEVDFKPSQLLSNDTTVTTSVALNAVTATTVAVVNENRTGFYASNNDNQDIILKLQAASVDNLAVGIPLLKRGGIYEMPPEKYRGEISAIASAGTPTIFIIEY